jgi:hypothetical protein
MHLGEQHQLYDFRGYGCAHAYAVALEDLILEGGGIRFTDFGIGQDTEPGSYAIDRTVFFHHLMDITLALPDRLADRIVQDTGNGTTGELYGNLDVQISASVDKGFRHKLIQNNFIGVIIKNRKSVLSYNSSNHPLLFMENLIFFLAAHIVLRFSSVSKKYNIGQSASFSLFFEPTHLNRHQASDGDVMYTGEWQKNGITYGLIVVDLALPQDVNESLYTLNTFINSLREPFGILHNSGISKAEEAEEGKTVTEYWQDDKGMDWKVKGFTNGRSLAVLYVKDISGLSVLVEDTFLDSFSFTPNKLAQNMAF